jgi:glutamyl-tRNA reductase
MLERAIKQRRHRPIFVVDLAVPRDVEAEVAEMDDVFLYTVDDLQGVIDEGLRSRQEAAVQAEESIAFHAEEFMAWLRSLDAAGLIQDYRQRAEQLRDEVLERAQRQLEAGKSPAEVINFLAHTLTNKLLHAPSTRLRQAAREGDAEILEAANELFQLEHGPVGTSSQSVQ